MKNLFKKINWFGVIALIATSTVVFAGSNASKRQGDRWGQDAQGNWHNVTNADPSAYQCNGNGICTAEYTSDPSAPGADPDALRIPETVTNGTFSLVD